MDVQTHDSAPVSENEQLSAPPGWTKKLVPASAKSVTLRKHDVVFIAPDGQEVKSKWHLSRYLKAHPDGPASSEFNWSSGEEAPKRRSTRVTATTKEDPLVEKSLTRKKGKRNVSEMDSEQAETLKESTQARKHAKKEGKSADLDGGAQDTADVPDEVMHEATVCDNEATQDALPLDEVQKEENEVTEVEASKEVVTDEVVEVEASTVVTEKAMDEVLDLHGEAVVPNATRDGEVHLTQVTVIEVKEVSTEREVSVNNVNTVQETSTFIGSSGEFKGEQAAMESEQPVEHADDNVMETRQLVDHADDNVMETRQLVDPADDNVMEPEENPEPKFEVDEEVFCKVTAVPSVVEEISKGDDTPSDPSKHEEEPLGPLAHKEELERPLTHVEIKERSASEFNGSSVPVTVSNQ